MLILLPVVVYRNGGKVMAKHGFRGTKELLLMSPHWILLTFKLMKEQYTYLRQNYTLPLLGSFQVSYQISLNKCELFIKTYKNCDLSYYPNTTHTCIGCNYAM